MPEQPPNPPLPPDPHRLRGILAFLNGEIADNDTLAAYSGSSAARYTRRLPERDVRLSSSHRHAA
ncbi:hypothetical protein ACFC8N_40800 [Streptomyces sp. NPDC055966]|uniref:hypothetical protein n=1 Tax=Streptomyces sp. NPDC055966 TaxID=3345669 RepID=UPI0035DD08C3